MGSAKPKGYVPNLTLFTVCGGLMIAIIVLIAVALAIGFPTDWRTEEGFLGTGASRMSDMTVIAYIILLVPLMLTGFTFARLKRFVPHHQVVMTLIVLFNWGLISFIMAASLRDVVDVEGLDSTDYRLLPIVHMLFGLTAQVVGTYLVIRMWFEESLPAALKIRKIKPFMRFTLACWLIAAALGITTYVTWYDPFSDDTDTITPVVTPEATEEPEITETPPAAEVPLVTPETTEEAE